MQHTSVQLLAALDKVFAECMQHKCHSCSMSGMLLLVDSHAYKRHEALRHASRLTELDLLSNVVQAVSLFVTVPNAERPAAGLVTQSVASENCRPGTCYCQRKGQKQNLSSRCALTVCLCVLKGAACEMLLQALLCMPILLYVPVCTQSSAKSFRFAAVIEATLVYRQLEAGSLRAILLSGLSMQTTLQADTCVLLPCRLVVI